MCNLQLDLGRQTSTLGTLDTQLGGPKYTLAYNAKDSYKSKIFTGSAQDLSN